MTVGAKIHCWRLSVAVNTRSGKIYGTWIPLQARLPNESKFSVQTSVEHWNKSGCHRKNVSRPRPGGQSRRNIACKKLNASGVQLGSRRGKAGGAGESIAPQKKHANGGQVKARRGEARRPGGGAA